jgi:flagellar biosynthesis protein FlhF
MNTQRFTARTARDALALVRQALGDDAVVWSTQPCAEGIEVLATGPNGVAAAAQTLAPAKPQLTTDAFVSARTADVKPGTAAQPVDAALPMPMATVAEDVERLSASTLSFQDYVRERMLKRRQVALQASATAPRASSKLPLNAPLRRASSGAADAPVWGSLPGPLSASVADVAVPTPPKAAAPVRAALHQPSRAPVRHALPYAALPLARESMGDATANRGASAARENHSAHDTSAPSGPPALPAAAGLTRSDQQDMMNELRSMKGLIEDRFGALAFMEKLQRQPAHARLTQKLLDCGFSPALIRKLAEAMDSSVADEMDWAAQVLEHNLRSAEHELSLEDVGGVYALVGATGVGKTTTTAKLAAAFATRYGAAELGLITLDAYRVGAHEQIRAYGRILGVPVHTAHDRASLDALLDLLSSKKMVLIDTAGMAQRDSRTGELLDMLSHPSIKKLLVVNAAAQGETIEDVLLSYRAQLCCGVVLSKLDEAVKLAPALDALIRHRLAVVGVSNGQRVPEDWHRMSAQALVHRALRPTAGDAYRMDASEVNLIFAAAHHQSPLPHCLSRRAVHHNALTAHA